jgi:hypothetical protein
VNVLCEHCLVNAFADERKMISIEMVEAVARDFDLENGDVSKATKAETQTRQSLEIFDMVDTLKTFGIWLTSYAGMSKPSARKGHS